MLSVGNLNVDLSVYVSSVPSVGGRVEARFFAKNPGGAAANFAVALARLGESSAVLGCVGRDYEGYWLIRELSSSGVDVSLVTQVDSVTGFVVVVVDENGERTMISYRGANSHLSEAAKKFERLNAEWVHVCSLGPEVAEAVFRAAKAAGAVTSYDPGGFVVKLGFETLRTALSMVDVLLVNEGEASTLEKLGGGPNLAKVLETVPLVVVKMGGRGSRALKKGVVVEAPAFPTSVVDSTGAGDVFDAAFCFALLRGLELQEALLFANACAALKVSRMGAQSGPTLDEAVQFLRASGYPRLAEKVRGGI